MSGLIVSSYLSFCVWLAAQFASRFLSALHGDDSSDDGDDDFEAEEARRREELLHRIRYSLPFSPCHQQDLTIVCDTSNAWLSEKNERHSAPSALMCLCVPVVCALGVSMCVLGVCVSVYVRLVSSHRLPATFQPKRVKDSYMHRKACTECGKDDWMEGELYFTDVW